MHELDQLIDLDRYPIHDLSHHGQALLARCQRELRESALCSLPEFLRPEVLHSIQREVSAANDKTWWVESERTIYSWRDLSDLPADHPARTTSPHRLGSITRDAFAPDSPLVRLFCDDRLTEFVRRCLNLDQLYRVECPWLSVNVKVMGTDSRHGWHFDTNDGAVTLLLQAAQQGGEFEYVPYIRNDDVENYDLVASIVRGEPCNRVQRVAIAPGTFCLFNGHRSLHRVSPVTQGDPARLIALFAYDREPAMHYNKGTLHAVLGAVPPGAD